MEVTATDLMKSTIPTVVAIGCVGGLVVASFKISAAWAIFNTKVDAQFGVVEREVGEIKLTVSDGFDALEGEVKGLRMDHNLQAIHRYQWDHWSQMFQMANPTIEMVEMPEPER